MTEPTERPWQQHDDHPMYGKDYGATIWTSRGPGHGLVADCRNCVVGTREVQLANAKLIVLAVNNHDALVDALEGLFRMDNHHQGHPDLDNEAVSKARSALEAVGRLLT